MAKQNPKKHIKLDGFVTSLDYTYPKTVGSLGLDLVQRIRNHHGNRILNQLNAIREEFNIPVDVNLPEGIVRDDAIYVDFVSEWGYKLDFDNLDQDKEEALLQILNQI